MRLSEHFDSSEFDCHGTNCGCGGRGESMNPTFIDKLEKLRYNIGGLPLNINSGYRCPKHNRDIDGAGNSVHCKWLAADVAVPSGMTIGEFKWYAEQIGFDAIGYYPRNSDGSMGTEKSYYGWLHLDMRDGGVNPNRYRWTE